MRVSMVSCVKKYLEKNKIENRYDILEGEDGRDLIKFILDDAQDDEIKYVITDENMEQINGSLAIKLLKQLEDLRKIKKKIYILASSDKSPNFKNDGFDYCINKPIKIDELDPIFNKHGK